MAREEFSMRQKDEILKRNMQRFGFPYCEVESCGAMCKRGKYHVDHIVPCWEGGKAEVSNGRIICLPCHKPKSAEETRLTAEADKKGRKDRGFKKAQFRPMPGTKASGWKAKISGEWERRVPRNS